MHTRAHAVTRVSRIVLNMVAERGACEWIAVVRVPQVVEQTIEVPMLAEQMLDVFVLETTEQPVKLPSTVSEDIIQERTSERIVDIPASRKK